MHLKSLHESLRSEYGLPGWASMLLFGLAVVIIGLLLGIGLVLFIDWLMGPQELSDERDIPQEPVEDKKENEDHEKKEEKVNEQEEKQEKKVRKRTVKAD